MIIKMHKQEVKARSRALCDVFFAKANAAVEAELEALLAENLPMWMHPHSEVAAQIKASGSSCAIGSSPNLRR